MSSSSQYFAASLLFFVLLCSSCTRMEALLAQPMCPCVSFRSIQRKLPMVPEVTQVQDFSALASGGTSSIAATVGAYMLAALGTGVLLGGTLIKLATPVIPDPQLLEDRTRSITEVPPLDVWLSSSSSEANLPSNNSAQHKNETDFPSEPSLPSNKIPSNRTSSDTEKLVLSNPTSGMDINQSEYAEDKQDTIPPKIVPEEKDVELLPTTPSVSDFATAVVKNPTNADDKPDKIPTTTIPEQEDEESLVSASTTSHATESLSDADDKEDNILSNNMTDQKDQEPLLISASTSAIANTVNNLADCGDEQETIITTSEQETKEPLLVTVVTVSLSDGLQDALGEKEDVKDETVALFLKDSQPRDIIASTQSDTFVSNTQLKKETHPPLKRNPITKHHQMDLHLITSLQDAPVGASAAERISVTADDNDEMEEFPRGKEEPVPAKKLGSFTRMALNSERERTRQNQMSKDTTLPTVAEANDMVKEEITPNIELQKNAVDPSDAATSLVRDRIPDDSKKRSQSSGGSSTPSLVTKKSSFSEEIVIDVGSTIPMKESAEPQDNRQQQEEPTLSPTNTGKPGHAVPAQARRDELAERIRQYIQSEASKKTREMWRRKQIPTVKDSILEVEKENFAAADRRRGSNVLFSNRYEATTKASKADRYSNGKNILLADQNRENAFALNLPRQQKTETSSSASESQRSSPSEILNRLSKQGTAADKPTMSSSSSSLVPSGVTSNSNLFYARSNAVREAADDKSRVALTFGRSKLIKFARKNRELAARPKNSFGLLLRVSGRVVVAILAVVLLQRLLVGLGQRILF